MYAASLGEVRRRPGSRLLEQVPLSVPAESPRVGQTLSVDVETVRVDGYHEVLALHRYLFECKGEDLSSEYAGSPFIAAIQNRLADALEAADPGSGWTSWRAADAHQQRVDAVRQYLSTTAVRSSGMSPEQRRAYAQDLLAPLRTPEALLAELVDAQASPVPAEPTDISTKTAEPHVT
jgi:hypothetical protein